MGVWKTVTPPSNLLGGCLLARTSKQIFAILGSWSLVALAGVMGWEALDLPGAFPGSYRGRTNDIKTRRSTATAPLRMQGCLQESLSAISGARCPDALLNKCFCTATPGYSTTVFSRWKSRVVSKAYIRAGRAKPFPGATAHTIHLARTKKTTHRQKTHTLNTTRQTQTHTTGTGPPICTGLPTTWVSGAGS